MVPGMVKLIRRQTFGFLRKTVRSAKVAVAAAEDTRLLTTCAMGFVAVPKIRFGVQNSYITIPYVTIPPPFNRVYAPTRCDHPVQRYARWLNLF